MSLDQHALAERLRTRQIKQWWIARQIGVAPLTVNRWLTGRVRRISIDNLNRLAEELQCRADELVLKSEADAHATQVEQSDAARLLVSPETQDMFISAGQIENYERLIKAVMHPNLSLQDLLEIYSVLTLAAGLRGDFERSGEYARVKLDFAQRCGDADKELDARINIITAMAPCGRLRETHAGLLDLYGAAESQGSRRSQTLALINLGATYHVLGEMGESLRCSLRALRMIQQPGFEFDVPNLTHWLQQVTCYIYFGATSVALECGEVSLTRALIEGQRPFADSLQMPAERDSMEMCRLVCDSMEGRPVDWVTFEPMATRFTEYPQFAIGGSILPAIVLRLHGRVQEALAYLEPLARHSGCQQYERLYIASEKARCHLALGDRQAADRQLNEARRVARSSGISENRSFAAIEDFGSEYSLPAKLVKSLLAMLQQSEDQAAA